MRVVLVVCLLQAVFAQDFCVSQIKTTIPDNVTIVKTRTASKVENVPLRTHKSDLIEGDCSGAFANNSVTMDPCIYPVPGSIMTARISMTFNPTSNTTVPAITCIKVVDNMADGTGGFPRVESGGIGESHVTIAMESQLSQGMKFDLLVHVEDAPIMNTSGVDQDMIEI